jgi:hypothetical protein
LIYSIHLEDTIAYRPQPPQPPPLPTPLAAVPLLDAPLQLPPVQLVPWALQVPVQLLAWHCPIWAPWQLPQLPLHWDWSPWSQQLCLSMAPEMLLPVNGPLFGAANTVVATSATTIAITTRLRVSNLNFLVTIFLLFYLLLLLSSI